MSNKEMGYKYPFRKDAQTQLFDDSGNKISNYISFIEVNKIFKHTLIFKHIDSERFPDQIISSYKSKNFLTLSNDEIPMDKKELWNERNELLNKVKSLPS
jgi:hypothetical protein